MAGGFDPANLKTISKAPDLNIGLEMYWQAFWDLTTCRQIGMGVGPIPWTSVQEYSILLELDEEQTDDLHYHIAVMDNEYLKWVNRNTKK